MIEKKQITILLADDDKDDSYFFTRALKKTSIPAKLTVLEDGEALINYLFKNQDSIPDVLFLDVNMPRKNGLECLTEIKANKKIKDFPIIIYSTSLNESVADIFYQKGAHYYLKKCEFNTLVKSLDSILNKLKKEGLLKEERETFVFNIEDSQPK